MQLASFFPNAAEAARLARHRREIKRGGALMQCVMEAIATAIEKHGNNECSIEGDLPPSVISALRRKGYMVQLNDDGHRHTATIAWHEAAEETSEAAEPEPVACGA